VKDYEFQLVSKEVKKREDMIAMKLVHKPSGRAIPDAVIIAKRIDMEPDNMASMAAPLELAGVYTEELIDAPLQKSCRCSCF